jgi:hypothetical protein
MGRLVAPFPLGTVLFVEAGVVCARSPVVHVLEIINRASIAFAVGMLLPSPCQNKIGTQES